jgi:hypothetical protein
MLLRLAALLALATSVFFIQSAALPILEQNFKVRQWPTVDADVTARFIDRSAGATTGPGRSKLLAPELQVEYRYEVNGTVHRSVHNTPGAEEWSPAGPDLVTKGEASYKRRGHYDPADPSQMIIPKPLGFANYWPILFWAPIGAIGLVGFVLRKPGRSRRMPRHDIAKGWHRLRPKYSMHYRANAAWAIALVCNSILIFSAYDYWTSEPRIRSTPASILMALGMVPGLIIVAFAIYYTWMATRVGEARVSIDTVNVTPGTRLAARFEIPIKANVDLEHVVVSLVRINSAFVAGSTGIRYRDRIEWEERIDRSVGKRAQAGTHVTFEQRFLIPADAAPSSVSGILGPWISWEIHIQLHLANGPDYRVKFPLSVDHPSLASKAKGDNLPAS